MYKPHENDTYAYAVPSATSGSDYSGGLVSSNYEVFQTRFADGEGVWWRIHGPLGSYGILLLCAAVPANALEWLAALDGYPLADDIRVHSK